MSVPRRALPAKLVVGFILKERDLVGSIVDRLLDRFGPLDLISPWLPFDYTNYYTREMGQPLIRRLLCFKSLVAQDALAEIKCATNQIEAVFASDHRRRVNIDPGLLSLERFVLATGKNFAHRIYLTAGIFADLTLIYRKGRFETLPWTYPDYAGPQLQAYLAKIRCKYQVDLKRLRSGRPIDADPPTMPRGVG